MSPKEKKEMGDRIKKFLKANQSNQADVAREISKRLGISFKAANVKISRIATGKYDSDADVWTVLYEKFRANIGFLITGKGEPHVKPFE
jgi:ribosomal protein L18E